MKYLSCAETAQHLRHHLAARFPGVVFSVTSKTYSGGASIRVRWLDGPDLKEVEGVTGQFEGAQFDGSIDLKTYNSHWLLPNGSIQFAGTPGTTGSRGDITPQDIPQPCVGAERVHLGADFIFCDRETPERVERRKEWELVAEKRRARRRGYLKLVA